MRRPLRLAAASLLALAAACASATSGASGAAATSTMTPGVTVAAPDGAPSAPAATVILVRHAERAADSPTDPTLTAEGTARAAALLATLRDAGVTHIITTELRRTQLTAAPLAAALGLTPEVVGTRGSTPHVEAMAAAVRRRGAGEVVLVVGHSNTVPAYVAALGGPAVAAICDAGYDNLLVLSPSARGPRLVRAKYGAASAGC